MKPETSLNPYAAPFIPPSRKRADNENVAPLASENSKINDVTVRCKQVEDDETKASKIICGDYNSSCENHQHQLPNNATLKFNNPEMEGPTGSRELLGKDYNINRCEDQMSHKTNDGIEKHGSIEDYEVDLAYLAAAFPALSEQSLVDVYCANAGDLEASVDMLTELEDDTILQLPHTLNTLDVSESGTVDDSSRTQATTAHGEASGSSSRYI